MKTPELTHLIVDDSPHPVCCDCGDVIYSSDPNVQSGGEFFHAACYDEAMESLVLSAISHLETEGGNTNAVRCATNPGSCRGSDSFV